MIPPTIKDSITRFARIAAVALLVGAAVLTAVLAVPGVVGADGSYVVLSGSMEPELSPGDVVVVRSVPPERIQEGDAITFRDEEGDRITHRVVEKRTTEDGVVYRTKGDANDYPDPELVSHSQVLGSVWFHVPAVGRFFYFVQRPLVQGLLIVVPGGLLLANGLRSIYRGFETD